MGLNTLYKYEKENRIDRDQLRYNLYDNIDKAYNLPFNSSGVYDLSRNPRKFLITDKVINFFGEYSFIRQMTNSQLYHSIFSNGLIHNNSLYNNYINNYINTRPNRLELTSPYVNVPNVTTYANTNRYSSYNNKYSNENKIDGYDLFKRSKYNTVKQDMESRNPRTTPIEINAAIEEMWKRLSASEQNAWNNSTDAARTSEYSLKYNHKDLTSYGTGNTSNVVSSLSRYANDRPCPINETPGTYKLKTGLVCYEICPPGRVRNAAGICTTINTYGGTR